MENKVPRLSIATKRAIRDKYFGLAICDMDAYLECRLRVRVGFMPGYYRNLANHYRRMFLNNPFRKGYSA